MTDTNETNVTDGKHKHCDLIVAWANGAKIEYSYDGVYWTNVETPAWNANVFHRIKPEPKPDIVMYGNIDNKLVECTIPSSLYMTMLSSFTQVKHWN